MKLLVSLIVLALGPAIAYAQATPGKGAAPAANQPAAANPSPGRIEQIPPGMAPKPLPEV